MYARVWLLCLTTLIVVGAGCGDNKKKAAPAGVKGTVTLDTKSLAEGEITFVLAGEAPATLPIKDGAFAGKAFVGKCKVEIRAYKVGPPLTTDPENKPTKTNFIPDRFNTTSTLEADVKAGDANDFTFPINSK